MQIKVDGNNLIIAFAEVGSLDGSIEISNSILPFSFVEEFKPGKFKYENGSIVFNINYETYTINTIAGEVESENARLRTENEQLKNTIITLMDRIDELENNTPS